MARVKQAVLKIKGNKVEFYVYRHAERGRRSRGPTFRGTRAEWKALKGNPTALEKLGLSPDSL